MKLKILLVLFTISLFSCQEESLTTSEAIEPIKTLNKLENSNYDNFINEGETGQLFSEFITVNNISSKIKMDYSQRCNQINFGSNNLNTCSTVYNLNPLNFDTLWNTNNNGIGYIDYELENFFNMHCDYSYTCIHPTYPVIQTMSGEIEFHESPTWIYDPELEDLVLVYYYLSDTGIPAINANELADFLACKMEEYRDANLPDAVITDVNLYGDALLCSGYTVRHLKASFTLNLHGPKPKV
ncbi:MULTISPECIES: hypothetical protein [Bizionia]|uniref:Uncharacterized protein n=1 Tax=Bizionia algoritergicola TaxID=291187 RepID=A0A5D0R426_9FLAO|nr:MULTISPECIES: hypothetical protein [Bizionia]OBX23656.1 hypothetical protein BAA08_03095 [Bizionia sp. APA-3]TYB75378.1 hypothetical protein ES675_04430 [Bizionia algoritergicola]